MTLELKEDFNDGVVRHSHDGIPSQYPREAREQNPVGAPLGGFAISQTEKYRTINPIVEEDPVAVGDLNSDAKGSGARKNNGKPQLDLIPVEFWYDRWTEHPNCDGDLELMLNALTVWQNGNTYALKEYLAKNCPREYFEAAVNVLEFGAQKYKAWNWAKGMSWSICVGCILRHTRQIIHGEWNDPESGVSHWGHIVCNIIFLVYYIDHYPEGDDRPPQYINYSE